MARVGHGDGFPRENGMRQGSARCSIYMSIWLLIMAVAVIKKDEFFTGAEGLVLLIHDLRRSLDPLMTLLSRSYQLGTRE